MNQHRTTARHFRIFREECLRAIREWRITGARIEFAHRKAEGVRAELSGSWTNSVQTLTLSDDWETDVVTNRKVRMAARHEVVHILLDKIDTVCQQRWCSKEQYKIAMECTVEHLLDILPSGRPR